MAQETEMAASVLVVEDERIIAKGIEKRLAGMGYRTVGLAASGEEAVRLADERRPDLVLMDIALGAGMDGVEAADRIRARHDLPVVFLTANSDAATVDRAKRAEPVGYVLKPFEDRDLQTAIEVGLYKHRADRRVRENEQWLATVLNGIGDGVVATDERGRVRFLNPVAERLTGWTTAAAAGRCVREVFPLLAEADRRAVDPHPVLDALARAEPVHLRPGCLLVARDGTERPVDDSAAPTRDAAGRVTGAVLVFRDVSDRKRLEEQLRQAQKLEAVGRLAGGIAHDFNNILTVVTGYSELLLDGAASEGRRREFAGQIHAAGRRAAALTQQLMAFSRKQVLKPVALDLNEVVRGMAALAGRLVGENIALVTDPDPAVGPVRADPGQLDQVVLNLVLNARDAMQPGGGRLTLTTAAAGPDRPAAPRPPDLPPGRYAVLAVSDTGRGIPPDVLPHIFEPFFTTKGPGRGTGLGLATVYGIVRQSGGLITVDSTPGRGTTFRVYLPVAEPADTPPPAGPTLPARGTETVLLVEDEGPVRRLAGAVLRQAGYTVLEADGGPAAEAAAAAHPGPIHLLVTDLVMPGPSGRQVADRLAAARPDLRVLYLSGYTDDVVVRQGVAAGTADLLRKPFTLSALTAAVRATLDRPARAG